MKLERPPLEAFTERTKQHLWGEVRHNLKTKGFAIIDSAVKARDVNSILMLSTQADSFRREETISSTSAQCRYSIYNEAPYQATILRDALYTNTVSLANDWAKAASDCGRDDLLTGINGAFPETYEEFNALCAKEAGQDREATMLLAYEAKGFNALHTDYDDQCITYPFQMAVMMSEPADHFTGGEFLIADGDKVHQIALAQGQAIIFPSSYRIIGDSIREILHGVKEVTALSKEELKTREQNKRAAARNPMTRLTAGTAGAVYRAQKAASAKSQLRAHIRSQRNPPPEEVITSRHALGIFAQPVKPTPGF